MRNVTLFFAVLFSSACLAGAAEAKLSLCNKTSYALSAAIAYVDGDRLATRGWWRLRPGQCKVVLTEPTTPGRYFAYAEAIPGHKGPLRAWSGETPLCVENSGFFNLRNQEVCKEDPTRQRAFFDIDVTDAAKGNWQSDFVEASNYSVYSAEVAGVQRLLNDVGASSARVDGSLGRTTQRDLAAYRQKHDLGPGAVIDDETIDKLIDEANALEAKLGFFYCNKASEPVWTAISEPAGEESYRSRGWWRLEPGDCAKVVKGQLAADHYYVYGVIEEARGERRLAGGDKVFCVNAVKFDSTNETSCADQELDEAVFKRVEIGGEPSKTYDFTVDMFVTPPATASNADAPAQTE